MGARAGVVLALLLGGCSAPGPEGRPSTAAVPCGQDIASEMAAAPTFTPVTVRPEVIDRAWFLGQAQDRIAEVSGPEAVELEPVAVWILVDSTGCTAAVRLESSSGVEAVDRVVQSHWQGAEWTRPLLRYGHETAREKAVPVWIRESVPAGRSSGF